MLSNTVIIGLISSFVTFQAFKQILDLGILPMPSGTDDPRKRFKWKNIVGSFVHAIYVAIFGSLCLYLTPEYLTERVETFEENAAFMTALSMGYFLHDIVDYLRNQKFSKCWAIILHHFFVFAIGIAFLWRERLLSYGMTCVLVEINGVFLHFRQLLLLYGISKQSMIYKINLIINLVTFAITRIGVFLLVVVCILADRHKMPVWENNMLLVDDIGLLILNVVVFYRILKADVFVSPAIKDCNGKKNDDNSNHVNGQNGKMEQPVQDVMDW